MKNTQHSAIVLCGVICFIIFMVSGLFLLERRVNDTGKTIDAVPERISAHIAPTGSEDTVSIQVPDTKMNRRKQINDVQSSNELVPLPTNEPLPYRIRHAVTHGAKAKITLRIVDSKTVPVSGALVGGGFYNHGEKGHRFEKKTDAGGEVTLEDTCVGDLNFGVIKEGYYDTGTTYWFFKNYFDCVKDGRWIPWNPTVEIVLKEKRLPVRLTVKTVNLNLPLKNTEYGFDFLVGDLVVPDGKGEVADIQIKCWGDKPYPPSRNYSNELLFVSTGIDGGFIRKTKDKWSGFPSDYEAPDTGYSKEFHLLSVS